MKFFFIILYSIIIISNTIKYFNNNLNIHSLSKTDNKLIEINNKIDVTYFFWYGCNYCNNFTSFIYSWHKNQKLVVNLKLIPIVFDKKFILHSKLYYVISLLGIEDKITSKIFKEIHINKNNLLTEKSQKKFLLHNGINLKKIINAYNLLNNNDILKKNTEILNRYKIKSVPILIVNRKYKIIPFIQNKTLNTSQILNYIIKNIKSKKM